MSPTVQQALRDAARRLAAGGIPDPARDARALVAEAMGIAPERVMPEREAQIPAEAGARLEEYLAERLRFRPVAQILGRRLFWGRWFRVTRDVLDPRPETEVLVAAALEGPAPRRILDLGTGSGAILLTLLAEWPQAAGVGTDLSPAALAVARENAERLGVAERAAFRRADWWRGLEDCGSFDLVVSNPPYISETDLAGLAPDVRDWEPGMALSPGPTGLESYREIAAGLAPALTGDGRACFEIGAGQGPAVAGIFRAAGLGRGAILPDLDGRDRVVKVARE